MEKIPYPGIVAEFIVNQIYPVTDPIEVESSRFTVVRTIGDSGLIRYLAMTPSGSVSSLLTVDQKGIPLRIFQRRQYQVLFKPQPILPSVSFQYELSYNYEYRCAMLPGNDSDIVKIELGIQSLPVSLCPHLSGFSIAWELSETMGSNLTLYVWPNPFSQRYQNFEVGADKGLYGIAIETEVYSLIFKDMNTGEMSAIQVPLSALNAQGLGIKIEETPENVIVSVTQDNVSFVLVLGKLLTPEFANLMFSSANPNITNSFTRPPKIFSSVIFN